MKKSLIALAVLAAAGAASAQSSVTLFGVVDATYQYGKGDFTKKHQLGNSGYNSSRLGFRGTEDLGGGMSATFWLEAGINNDDGTGNASSSNNQVIGAFNPATGANAPVRSGTQGLTFQRRSTVSLAGGWGEVRLGRDYTPQFWNLTVFDPFGTNGVGTTLTLISPAAHGISGSIADPVNTRASNSFGYFLPGNLGGFYGQAMFYLGENAEPAANEDDGRGAGVRLGWAGGPFNVAGAYAKTNFAAADVTTANVGGQWDFGFAKLMGQYNDVKVEGSAIDLHIKGWLVGGLVPVGAGEIRVAYSTTDFDFNNAEAKKFAIGYVHNLSKRTAVYATYARIENEGGGVVPLTAATATAPATFQGIGLNGATTTVNGKADGFDIGIRHSF